MLRLNSNGRTRNWSAGALAALTALTVGGTAVGDAGPSGAGPRAIAEQKIARQAFAKRAILDQQPSEKPADDVAAHLRHLNPKVRQSVRRVTVRVRERRSLPRPAPTHEPKQRGESPKKVAVDYAANGIPAVAMQAYRNAAGSIDAELPACHLDWSLLAGIGRIESNHGRFGGSPYSPAPDGQAIPTVLGAVLDGSNDTARITDTDGGRYDHDGRFDRAVGPMQFLPGTWDVVGADGNGDGTADPNNVFDAALGAAEYLCAADRNLHKSADLHAAVFSYNHSEAYVADVVGLAQLYGEGRSPAVPTAIAPPGWEAATQRAAEEPTRSPHAHRPHRDREKHPTAPTKPPKRHPHPSDQGSGSPTPRPTGSTPSSPPKPKPTDPTPPPPSSQPAPSPTGLQAPDAPQRPAIVGGNPVLVMTLTPSFSAIVKDSTDPLDYVFQLWSSGSGIPGATQLAEKHVVGQAGKLAEWTLGAQNRLKDRESYSVRALAERNGKSSGWSEWLHFTAIVLPAPTPITTPTPTTPTPTSTESSSAPASSAPSNTRDNVIARAAPDRSSDDPAASN